MQVIWCSKETAIMMDLCHLSLTKKILHDSSYSVTGFFVSSSIFISIGEVFKLFGYFVFPHFSCKTGSIKRFCLQTNMPSCLINVVLCWGTGIFIHFPGLLLACLRPQVNHTVAASLVQTIGLDQHL